MSKKKQTKKQRKLSKGTSISTAADRAALNKVLSLIHYIGASHTRDKGIKNLESFNLFSKDPQKTKALQIKAIDILTTRKQKWDFRFFIFDTNGEVGEFATELHNINSELFDEQQNSIVKQMWDNNSNENSCNFFWIATPETNTHLDFKVDSYVDFFALEADLLNPESMCDYYTDLLGLNKIETSEAA